MGGGGKPEPTVEENVDNTNIGLLNLSENGLNKFGIGEILTVLLVMLVLGIIVAYYCKKRRQTRLLEMEQSLRNSLGAYRPAQEELYPHRQGFQTLTTNVPSAPIPMVTFSSPGTRQVGYKPEGTLPGFWEACK